MKKFNIFRTEIIFAISRIACIALFILSLVGALILGGAMASVGQGSETPPDGIVLAAMALSRVPASEAANDLLSAASNPLDDVPRAGGFAIPAPLNMVLRDDSASRPVLDSWLGEVPFVNRQQFLNELSNVVTLASQHAATWEWDDRERYVVAAMGQYAQIKISVLQQAEAARESAREKLTSYQATAGILLVFVLAMVMMLSLLAIERNTRAYRSAAENGFGSAS